MPSFARHWTLDPDVTFLNHGSFGACPRPVLEAQSELRARLEREPVQFMAREWEPRMDEARRSLAEFVGADPDGLAFVSNATGGVNTVLRSLTFSPGDEILVIDQGYNACQNAARFAAERSGARVVVAHLPFPLTRPEQVTDAILERVTPKTRLALVDHVTSATGLVLPIEAIVRGARRRRESTPWSTAPTRRAWCPWPWTRWAPPTTRATATSGCARPRARPSSTCARTDSTWSIPS